MPHRRTFKARVWNCMPAFQVPRHIARSLTVWDGDEIALAIRRRGHLIYHGPACLISGTELRSGDAIRRLREGELISVTVSRLATQQ
jgi:hypothetical protein